jgi:ABC-type glycerol-3-phosphate transport system permease component
LGWFTAIKRRVFDALEGALVSIRRLAFHFPQAIAIVVLGVPLIWLLLSAFEPEVLIFQAWRIAGNRPYCIAVPDMNYDSEMRYKRVTNRKELTWHSLTTRVDFWGSGAPMSEFYYAILVLNDPNETRNWSKFQLNFESDIDPHQSGVMHENFDKPNRIMKSNSSTRSA